MADADRLRAWAFPAFHTAVLVAVGVTVLHWVGALGGALAGLDTATGLVAYGALWATAWTTNRRVLATATPGGPLRTLLPSSAVWGAVTGAAFLLELVALLVAGRVLAGGVVVPLRPRALLDVLAFLPVLGIVAAVAAVVGGVIGAALAVVDAGAARAAAALVGKADQS